MLELSTLQKLMPSTKIAVLETYVEPIKATGEYYEMFANTQRIAAFLAQVIHESGGFKSIEENLNYSAEGLTKIFPKYFPTLELAKEYARKPEKIANRVYANRMKNGDEASGDGWNFRGRGLIQITGRDNYTRLATALNMTLEETTEYLKKPEGATASAGWFWDANKLNAYCDKNDFVGLTKRINGGTIGLEHRLEVYNAALKLLQG